MTSVAEPGSSHFKSNLRAASGLFYGVLEIFFGLGTIYMTSVIVSRTVNVSDFGVWSTAIQAVTLISLLTSLRAEVTLAQVIGRARGAHSHAPYRTITLTGFLLVTVFSGAVSLVLVVIGASVGDGTEVLAIIGLTLTPISLMLVLVGVQRGQERMRASTITRVVPYLIWLVAAIGLAIAHASLKTFAAVYTMTISASIAVQLMVYWQSSNRQWGIASDDTIHTETRSMRSTYLRLMLVTGLPLGLAMLLDQGQNQLSGYVVILSQGATKAGIYNAGYWMASILSKGLVAIIGIFVPLTARLLAENNLNMARSVYQRVTRWVFLPTLIAAATAFVYAPTVLCIYGREYASGSTAFRILIVGFVINVLFGPNRAFLIASNRGHLILYSTLLTTALTLMVSVVLVPQWGIEGAAVAAAINIILGNLWASGWLWFTLHTQPFTRPYLNLISFGTLSAAVLGSGMLALTGSTLLGAILFGLLYSLLLLLWVWKSGFADGEDRELGHYLLRRIRPSRA
ncbi:MAG: oligosaccharide flippase family protein [Chloroflexi bacterium]|nr:oligosaccharide flippase family protein [Chloroflexota bacterium]